MRCISGGAQKAHLEALQTAGSALRLILKTCNAALPGTVVIISIYYVKTQAEGVSGALLLADHVLLIRIYVGVAVVDGGRVAVLQHPLNDGSAAWRTACM